jgi:ribonuclease E
METPTLTTQKSDMSELSNEEQERLENWKALQLALGLSPEEVAASMPPPASPPKTEAQVTPPAPPAFKRETKAPPLESEEIHLFGEGIISPEPEVESAADVEDGQEVEVGEAPEEIPDEPAPADDKKRRRRRRRRGRRGGAEGGPDSAEAPGAEEAGPLFDTGAEMPAAAANAEDLEDEEEGAEEEEDDIEVEPISFADWTVPTWNELIGSLYRPER